MTRCAQLDSNDKFKAGSICRSVSGILSRCFYNSPIHAPMRELAGTLNLGSTRVRRSYRGY